MGTLRGRLPCHWTHTWVLIQRFSRLQQTIQTMQIINNEDQSFWLKLECTRTAATMTASKIPVEKLEDPSIWQKLEDARTAATETCPHTSVRST